MTTQDNTIGTVKLRKAIHEAMETALGKLVIVRQGETGFYADAMLVLVRCKGKNAEALFRQEYSKVEHAITHNTDGLAEKLSCRHATDTHGKVKRNKDDNSIMWKMPQQLVNIKSQGLRGIANKFAFGTEANPKSYNSLRAFNAKVRQAEKDAELKAANSEGTEAEKAANDAEVESETLTKIQQDNALALNALNHVRDAISETAMTKATVKELAKMLTALSVDIAKGKLAEKLKAAA